MKVLLHYKKAPVVLNFAGIFQSGISWDNATDGDNDAVLSLPCLRCKKKKKKKRTWSVSWRGSSRFWDQNGYSRGRSEL